MSATYNGVTATDSITIFYDDAITLKATSKDGFGSFAWSTGATNSNITVKNLRRDTLFTVAFKNQGGAISYDTIRVHLKYFRPQMAVNGKVKVDTVQCLCQPGDKVAFAPYVPSTFKDIRFQWSSGSTERSVTYNDIQTTIVDTLVYTLFGKSDTVCYVAYLSDTLDSAIPEGYYLIRDRFTTPTSPTTPWMACPTPTPRLQPKRKVMRCNSRLGRLPMRTSTVPATTGRTWPTSVTWPSPCA